MSPLKILIKASGVVLPSLPMHLDDILAAAAVNQFLSNGTIEIENYSDITDYLPIEKQTTGRDWVYKSSVVRWEFKSYFMKSITRKVDPYSVAQLRNGGLLKYNAKDVNSASGPLKSSIDLIPCASYAEGVAYLIGDKDKLRQLLSHIDYVGRKHNRGCGKVIEIEVTDCEDANQYWKDRFLPLSMQELSDQHSLTSNIGIKPPYWKNKHQVALGVKT